MSNDSRHSLINPTDVDENNIRTAQHNVALNNLDSRILLVKTDPAGPLFPLDQIGQET
jgi:23S rRNA (adenine1618-N6)-methyltransferase